MKTVLYIGMENKPIEVETRQHINNRYQVETDYYNMEGNRIMLQAQNDIIAHDPPCDFMQYPNYSKPIIKTGSIVSPAMINNGYSCHNFSIIII
jgi:hypothetical protein